jgi:TPR repeat protein
MPACVAVASMLSDGRGGTLDLRAGNAMMARACNAGDFYACMNRGYRFLDGSFGEPKDTIQAQVAFQRACAVAVRDHPYPWYRRAIGEGCQLAANPKS